MTPTEQDLARQLAQHERWKWMRGMCAVTAAHPVDEFRVIYPKALRDGSELATCIPDIADPATQGCLIAVLHGIDPYAYPYLVRTTWFVARDEADVSGATLGEALARSLLAAWEVSDE